MSVTIKLHRNVIRWAHLGEPLLRMWNPNKHTGNVIKHRWRKGHVLPDIEPTKWVLLIWNSIVVRMKITSCRISVILEIVRCTRASSRSFSFTNCGISRIFQPHTPWFKLTRKCHIKHDSRRLPGERQTYLLTGHFQLGWKTQRNQHVFRGSNSTVLSKRSCKD